MRLTLLFTFLILSLQSFAAMQTDSLAYNLQRNKINEMLNVRSLKFGSYAESLNSRTGIFGLKTKRDMQKSIDILAEIIQTDNAILKETKTLLDYKTFEQEKVLSQSKESEYRNLAYMRTINKLENENEKNKTQLLETNKSLRTFKILFFITLIVFITGGVFLYRKIYRKK